MNAIMGDSVASPTVWIVTIVVTVGVLLVDLLVIARRPTSRRWPRSADTWPSSSGWP